MLYSLGIDVGGTFTDVALADSAGNLSIGKVPTTPKDLFVGVISSIKSVNVDLKDVGEIIHGSTIVANAIIQRKGVKTALITTKGFRDVLELQRGDKERLYDLQIDKYPPLVPRELRFEVDERVNSKGEVLRKLNIDELEAICGELERHSVKSVAICFLFSFLYPEHEKIVRNFIRSRMPDVHVSISADILPLIREYERMNTTVSNSYVAPLVDGYLKKLETKLKRLGFLGELWIMHSSGAVMPSAEARLRPIYTWKSGPASGVVGAKYIAEMIGHNNIISIDAGGTSFDVCLVKDGKPSTTRNQQIQFDIPVAVPTLDIHCIGAGGGSIAWIDSGGSFRVGPQSAAADPGPVCYGKEGKEPTVTDANLVLGYINPSYFLGGKVELDLHSAAEAIKEKIADHYGISMLDAARGINEIATAHMVDATRLISTERGYDPRDFALVAFGGAGPQFALRLAEELQIETVIIPPNPGALCSIGALLTDVRRDLVQTFLSPLAGLEVSEINQVLSKLKREGLEYLERAGIDRSRITLNCSAYMRYCGQMREIPTNLPSHRLAEADIPVLARRFHEQHYRIYRHSAPEKPCEIVNLHVSVIGSRKKPKWKKIEERETKVETFPAGKREVFFDKFSKYVEVPVYRRGEIPSGTTLTGPAIIEEVTSTTVLEPDKLAKVDVFGNIVVQM